MSHNIKVLGILAAIIVIFSIGNVNATQTNINAKLYGNFNQKIGAYINNSKYPSLYTKSATYDVMFAIADADGNIGQYYNAYVGGTFTVSSPSSVLGPNSIIQLRLKSKTFHVINSYSGILFH